MVSGLSLIGIVLAFALLIAMMMKGVDLFVTVMCCAVVVVLTSRLNLYNTLIDTYMTGFVGYYKSYFMMFLVGTIFGRLMEITGGAAAIAKAIIKVLKGNAYLAIPLATGVIVYGGVNCFVSMFATIPIAVAIFREHDITRRLMPAALYFGAATFAMVAPGTPQIQNIVPTTGLGQSLMAGTVGGFVGVLTMFVVGSLFLRQMINKARKNGERFEDRKTDAPVKEFGLPNALVSVIPLAVTLIVINIKINDVSLGIEPSVLIGCICTVVCLYRFVDIKKIPVYLSESISNAAMVVFNISTIVGFGSIIKTTSGFQQMVDWIVNIPGPYLIGAAIGTTLICGICGSASGGLGIATPILNEIYSKMPGVSMRHIARIMSLSSSALDSSPHSGAVTSIIKLCGETHKSSYMPVFWVSVVTPAIGTAVAIIFFSLFPNLP